MNAARRTMRHVDVFSWLSTERQKVANELALHATAMASKVPFANLDFTVQRAHQMVALATRLQTLDNLLSQLQDG